MTIKKPSWRFKLMTLFAGILGLSLIIQIFYVIPYIRNQEIEKTQFLHEEIAGNISQVIDTDILHTLGRAKELAELDIFCRMDIPAMQKTMDIIVEGSYRIESISALNSQGWFICGTMEDFPLYTTKSNADKPFFTVPFEEGKTNLSSPRYYTSNNLVAISMSVPIESETGERVGVLIAVMRLNHLIDAVKYYPPRKSQVVYVVDNKCKVIAHSNIDLFALEDGPLSLSSDCPLLIQNILSGEKDGSIKYKHEGKNYYVSYALLESNGWGVVVEASMKSILAEFNIVSKKILFINLLIFTIALIITIILARQITAAQRKADETLRESEEKHRKLIETTSEGFWLINFEKKTIDVNQSFCDMLGYSRNEIIGKTPFDFIDDENRKIFKEQTLQITNTKHRTYEISLKKKNGDNFPTIFNETSLVDKNGKPAGSFAFVTDITERKQTEKALQESEERFRQVAESTEEWIWEVDDTALYTYSSPIVEKLLGYTPEEIVGKKHAFNLFHPDDIEPLKKATLELFAEKKPLFRFLNKNVHKNGSIVWLSTSGLPILDDNGNLVGYRGADIDITEQKKAEQELKKHREHLEELVQERTRELDEKNIELKRYNKLFEGREFRIKELRDKVKELEKKESS